MTSAPEPPVLAPTTEDAPCESFRENAKARVVEEPGGPRRKFSWHGYLARTIRLERSRGGATLRHCVTVAWPSGEANSDGKRVNVAWRISDAWLALLENTLARLPWAHVSLVRRVVIDDRPTEHGIAAFDRRAPDDARDGRTVWLHHRLFTEANHWSHGNFGTYWSYHTNDDALITSKQPASHTLFSPVLLHEIGHLVSYALVNGDASKEGVPECARMCADRGGCAKLSPEEKEAGCISPYCMPFKVPTGTENWAEQYRFYFQSRVTRELLGKAKSSCVAVLRKLDDGEPAPWDAGLPDVPKLTKSQWASCGGKACKAW